MKSIVASVAIHGLLVLLAVASLDRDSILPPPQTATIEITVEPVSTRLAPVGGDHGSPRPATHDAQAVRASTSTASTVRRSVARSMSTVDDEHASTTDEVAGVAAIVGEVKIDADEGAARGGNGDGGHGDGDGRGTGRGMGDGIGDAIGNGRGTEELVRMPLPAPPAASKARPARLIYPSRQTEVEETALFVAAVTVDTDGYVVGAHLTRGFGGKRDADASSLIFRFRYEPALDDTGRPIRSTVEQHFHVAR